MLPADKTYRLLFAEDDTFSAAGTALLFEDYNFEVTMVTTGSDAIRVVREAPITHFHAAVLDVMMPPGDELAAEGCRNGYRTGLTVARHLRKLRPQLPLFAYTASIDPEVSSWFARFGSGHFQKPLVGHDMVLQILRVVAGERPKPKCFIVHGHDTSALLELKDYLQNFLGFPEPTVLRELPSLGRTVIEKFEEVADGVDLVFVLLTPDDLVASGEAPDAQRRRARQNVIFEAGYFLAKLQRRRGAVILLHGGELELPSDIAGLIYIDISDGVLAIGETLRRELRSWLA